MARCILPVRNWGGYPESGRALHRAEDLAGDSCATFKVIGPIDYVTACQSVPFSLDDMNSVSRPRSRISLAGMIVGGLLAVAPVFGPLGKTLHYLDDFIAERPQPMRTPDISFFVELLALIICPVGLLLFALSLFFLIRSGRRTAPRA
jgi:hypothetical protein